MTELLPLKATFAPGEPVEVELRGGARPVRVSLWRLDELVAEIEVGPGESVARFPAQPEGGYGVEAPEARTALDVLADPLSRARYGFVSDYAAGRGTAGVADNVRRLHLNAVQFYDWMYRHAQLLPPADDFVDALGRSLSLDSVRRLAAAVCGAGSLPLGYAAVYAAGVDEWPAWREDGLYRASGEPWMLGDFLWNVDPTSERWLTHFAADLEASLAAVGFAGFHLDQYGAPKVALRADGTPVDLADAFPALIDRLADLARLVEKARLLAPRQSVILAAYLSVYAGDSGEEAACAAQDILLATAFSHGATPLLHGEERAALTEAYYVTHAELSDASMAAARRYWDFAVRYGDLLFERDAVDVTRTHLGGVNEDLKIEAPVPVSTGARAGALWARVVKLPHGLLVSLVDLSAQPDDLWDSPKRPGSPLAGVHVSVERRRSGITRFLFASPDDTPALLELHPGADGRYDTVELPPFRTWAILWLPDEVAA